MNQSRSRRVLYLRPSHLPSEGSVSLSTLLPSGRSNEYYQILRHTTIVHSLSSTLRDPQAITMPFFRFCDLPPEIRTFIYEELIPLNIRLYDNGVLSHGEALRRYRRPALLRVSKSLRQEALDVVARSIEILVIKSSGHLRIPSEYLTHVQKVCITNSQGKLPNERTIPKLKLLVIYIVPEQSEDPVDGADKEQLCKTLVTKATQKFEGSRRHTEVEKRRSDGGKLPFRVVIELAGLFCSGSRFGNGNENLLWSDVVVDWEEQELVEGWPPPKWKGKDE